MKPYPFGASDNAFFLMRHEKSPVRRGFHGHASSHRDQGAAEQKNTTALIC